MRSTTARPDRHRAQPGDPGDALPGRATRARSTRQPGVEAARLPASIRHLTGTRGQGLLTAFTRALNGLERHIGSAHSLARKFLTYWTPKGWSGLSIGRPIELSYNSDYQKRGVTAGDKLYIVNVAGARARLLGSFEVESVLPQAAAARKYGRTFKGKYVAVAKPGTATRLQIREMPTDLVKALRFNSKERPAVLFDSAEDVNQQTLRAVRELTDPSAQLLERFLSRAPSPLSGGGARDGDDDAEAPPAPSPSEYVAALRALEGRIGEQRTRMLRAHYLAPDQTATMRQLSQAAQMRDYQAANGMYGGLGKLLATEIGQRFVDDFEARHANWTAMIATGQGRTGQLGEFAWKMRPQFARALEVLGLVDPDELKEEQDRDAIPDDVDGPAADDPRSTERRQLQLARVGQGAFRRDVVAYWGACAVTGCRQTGLLIASHIRPWRRCETDAQRLDGGNGLLLTPNLDRLFDRGFISFADDGRLLVAAAVSRNACRALGLAGGERIAGLSEAHRSYLDFHRQNVFLGSRPASAS